MDETIVYDEENCHLVAFCLQFCCIANWYGAAVWPSVHLFKSPYSESCTFGLLL